MNMYSTYLAQRRTTAGWDLGLVCRLSLFCPLVSSFVHFFIDFYRSSRVLSIVVEFLFKSFFELFFLWSGICPRVFVWLGRDGRTEKEREADRRTIYGVMRCAGLCTPIRTGSRRTAIVSYSNFLNYPLAQTKLEPLCMALMKA